MDELLDRDESRGKILNAIWNCLEALSTRSFADCMLDFSSISASSDAEDSITIDDGLKIAAVVSGFSSIKSLVLHDAGPKDAPNVAKGLIAIDCLLMWHVKNCKSIDKQSLQFEQRKKINCIKKMCWIHRNKSWFKIPGI